MNKNLDSLTQLSQHQEKWQKWRKYVLRHKQTFIFVAMDAHVRICEDDLVAISSVTAMPSPDAFDLSLPNQLATNRYARAFPKSGSNRLVIANKNAHAFGLSSSLARHKMMTRMQYSRSKNVSILENSSPRL